MHKVWMGQKHDLCLLQAYGEAKLLTYFSKAIYDDLKTIFYVGY